MTVAPVWPLLPGLMLLAFVASASAEDWPQFGRDKTRNAVSPEKNPPTWWQYEDRERDGKISPGVNIRWSAHLETGYNTPGDPVVVDGLVWVGGGSHVERNPDAGEGGITDHFSTLYCLDEKTGKELYRLSSLRLPDTFQSGRFHGHSSCPLIEGDRLWVVTNRAEVVCLDIGPLKKRTGKPRELWTVDMRKTLGVCPRAGLHDNRRCSIAGHKDWIYVITGHGDRNEEGARIVVEKVPSLVCFEKATGKVVWQDNSPGKDVIFGQFASPTIIEIKGQTQVIAPQGDGWVRSFEPATGKLIWKYDTNPHDTVRTQLDGYGWGTRNHLPASAVFDNGRLYIGNGCDTEHAHGVAWLHCIDPSKTGDISPEFTTGAAKGRPNPNSGMVWRFGGEDKNPKPGQRPELFHCTVSNVAIGRGLLIAADVPGYVYCFDARTGRQLWKHDTKGQIQGNPLIVDGKVFVGSEDVWVLELAEEKKILNRIEGAYSKNSPVFANGVLYIGDNQRMYAIAGNEKPPRKEASP